MKKRIILSSIACALAIVFPSQAEEGGSAHYMPGSTASFIDAFPGQPNSLALMNFFTYYDAKVAGNRQLSFGGLVATEVRAKAYADTVAAVYEAPWQVARGQMAFGVAIPYVWMEVNGQVQRVAANGAQLPARSTSDSADGIGDLMLYPFMLGWTNLVPDLKVDARLGIYAPSGEYEKGRLANVGKNYWTFEPGIMASYLSSKYGTEVSLFTGLDFNTRNDLTDYQSGNALHLDATIAQHLPLWGGFVGVGANAFYYQQISGDSGSGALLGEFEGRTLGVGPVLSYVRPIGKAQLLAEVKWLPELDTAKRLRGDYIWFKLGILF